MVDIGLFEGNLTSAVAINSRAALLEEAFPRLSVVPILLGTNSCGFVGLLAVRA